MIRSLFILDLLTFTYLSLCWVWTNFFKISIPSLRNCRTECSSLSYNNRAVFTWLTKGIGFGFGFGFGFTTPFGWLVYLLWFWLYDSQVKTALKSRKNHSIFVIDSCLKDSVLILQLLKGMQSCRHWTYVKGVPFVNRRYMKGVPFSWKMVY